MELLVVLPELRRNDNNNKGKEKRQEHLLLLHLSWKRKKMIRMIVLVRETALMQL
jgi:hypothetical protein